MICEIILAGAILIFLAMAFYTLFIMWKEFFKKGCRHEMYCQSYDCGCGQCCCLPEHCCEKKHKRDKWFCKIPLIGGLICKSKPIGVLIYESGFSYDAKQDIFYSELDAWQHEMGYCELYDEAAAPLSMIIDCQPFYFDYDGKKWLLEFWKGQYGMTTGGEIGIYSTDGPEFEIPGVFNGTLYKCADKEDYLQMQFALYKNNKKLFERKEEHWWLTGFVLGEFSEPEELFMDAQIAFKSKEMCEAVAEAMRNEGFAEGEYEIDGTSLRFSYKAPRAKQPITRTELTDAITQMKNKELCELYNEATEGIDGTAEKLTHIKQTNPKLYKSAVNIGKTKSVFKMHKKLEKTEAKFSV